MNGGRTQRIPTDARSKGRLTAAAIYAVAKTAHSKI
jgi:hypothetical protein